MKKQMKTVLRIWKALRDPSNFILTFGTLALGILFVLIVDLEMRNMEEKEAAAYIQQQLGIAQQVVSEVEKEPEETYAQRLSDFSFARFETSGSQLLYVLTEEKEIYYVKNREETQRYAGQKWSAYYAKLEKGTETYMTQEVALEDGYYAGVCIRESYIAQMTGFDMMYLRIRMYGIIAAVCFVMIVYYLQYIRIRSLREISELKAVLREKQLLLERKTEKEMQTAQALQTVQDPYSGGEEVSGVQGGRVSLDKLFTKIPGAQYKFSFYLNASHAIYIDGVRGEIHPHTWEIVIHVMKTSRKLVLFNRVEQQVENYLQQYQGKIMNDFEPFTALNPTLENLTTFFLKQLQQQLGELGWTIFMMEVSETPTRTYVISLLD